MEEYTLTKVLIIGATGSVGRVTRQYFLDHTDDELTLMARNTDRLGSLDTTRESMVKGSVTDSIALQTALNGKDVVFAALSGDLPAMATAIVDGMDKLGISRLLFITSMGIYNEIPVSVGAEGNLQNNPMLKSYRQAADIISASDLNYTIIRPGWFDNRDDIDYQVTKKGEPFGGHDVSIKSIADLVVKLTHDEQMGSRDSLGINRR